MGRHALIIYCLLLWCLLAGAPHLHAQDEKSEASRKSLLSRAEDEDSLQIAWYHWGSHELEKTYIDTLALDRFNFYEYDYDGKKPFANLGTPATQRRWLWWSPEETETGMRLGLRAFQAFRWDLESYTYPIASKPYTRVVAVQGTAPGNTTFERQQNSRFDILFTRPFTDRLQVFLDYRWMDYFGLYSRQRSKVGRLATGMDYTSPDSSYEGRLLVLMNAGQWEDNGGITSDTFLVATDPYRVRNNVPIHLRRAQSRIQERRFVLDHQIRIFKGLPEIHIQNMYYTSYRKHVDADPDSTFFREAYDLDERGLRRFGQLSYFDNQISIPLIARPDLHLEGGASYRSGTFKSTILGEEKKFDQAGIFGNLRYDHAKFGVQARTRINWMDSELNYRTEGTITIEPLKSVILKSRIWSQRQRTALMDTDFAYNGTLLHENPSTHTRTLGLDASLHLEKLGLTFSARGAELTNQVVFNRSLNAFEALDGSVRIIQASVDHDLKWGFFSWHNRVGYQSLGDYSEILGMPDYFYTTTMQIEGYVFKRAMWASFGAYMMYVPEFRSLKYLPTIGEFIQAPEAQPIAAYPLVNLYLHFRVDKLQAFIMMENATSIIADQHWFTTPDYPMTDLGYKIGLLWHFRN